MLVASGQGEIEVNIPSQRAEPEAIKIDSINRLLGRELPRHEYISRKRFCHPNDVSAVVFEAECF